ncbi:MAG: ParB/RepB/Spo0J family partition protein [Candidatus Moranbacteria bacterium]|nr:ParB/RepB/Spo0J family partition protein [Candidatus Moranbacteria bacterium]
MNNNVLGRGLASLIPQKKKPSETENGNQPQNNFSKETRVPASSSLQDEFLEVAIGKIARNPQQPRHDFDETELQELADSIKEHGIIQPLIVAKIAPEQYELIAGERRLKASKLAGLSMVPVIVREEAGEREKLELALVENVQRHDLNPIEEGRAFKKLIEEFDLTQEQISERVGKSRSAVANKTRLLALPVEIQRALIEGKISEGHARTILAIENLEKQRALFELILKDNLTVRQAEDKVREVTVNTHQRRISADADPYLKEKEGQIAQALGTKVTIKKSGGGGKIIVDYYSEEELENIAGRFL